MPARDYYLKDKTLETLCQREQRPTHAHRCAGLACGARSAPGGWLREARRWVCCGLRRTGARVEFRLPVWLRGVFIIAVHHAFVLGLGARHGGIVKLSVVRCVTVFACFTYLLTYDHPEELRNSRSK